MLWLWLLFVNRKGGKNEGFMDLWMMQNNFVTVTSLVRPQPYLMWVSWASWVTWVTWVTREIRPYYNILILIDVAFQPITAFKPW